MMDGWCNGGGGIDGSFCYRILKATVPHAVLHLKQGVLEHCISKEKKKENMQEVGSNTEQK